MKNSFALVFKGAFGTLLLVCLVALDGGSVAHAQNAAALRATYGRGVHAYFRGQSLQADRLLTEVAEAGSTDPRVFYFRAMARLRSGRLYEAESDMQIGAALEARNPGLGSTISKSLERVQGTHRRKLEKYRREARLNRLGEQRQQSTERYEKLRERESSVLRREVDVPLEDLTGPGLPAPAGLPTGSPKPAESGGNLAEPDTGDPFGTEVPAGDEPAEVGDDPFSEPTNPSSEEPTDDIFNSSEPEEAPSTDADDDPFAAEPESSADPFAADEGAGTSEVSGLAEADKVKPSKLVGILGRVVGSAMPWQGLEMPQMPVPGMGPGPGFDPGATGDEIALGPMEADSNVFPAAASEADPFGGQEAQPEANATEEASFENAESSEELDDPFANF